MPILNVRVRGVVQDAHGNDRDLPANQALARRGPVVTVSLRPLEEQCRAMAERGEAIPAAVDGLGLIDTGASVTCVDAATAGRAGLSVMDQATISSASHSAHRVPVFAGEIEVAGLGRNRLPRRWEPHSRARDCSRSLAGMRWAARSLFTTAPVDHSRSRFRSAHLVSVRFHPGAGLK